MISLLKIINDDDLELTSAGLAALAASIVTQLLIWFFVSLVRPMGILIGAALGAIVVGLMIAIFFGVAVYRALSIGGLYVVASIAVSFGFYFLFSR